MNNFELIKYVYEELVALKDEIFELKREIEELKYFNREVSFKLPDFQSENKKNAYNKWTFLTLLKNQKLMNQLNDMNITVTKQSLARILTT